jgi:hypothetical protein
MTLSLPFDLSKGAARFGWDKGTDFATPGMSTVFTPGATTSTSAPDLKSDMGQVFAGIGSLQAQQNEFLKQQRAEEEDRQLRQARERQKLGKESLSIASMYNQINKLPGTIASAFGGNDQLQLMLGTYGNIPAIVSDTYRSFPQRSITPVGSQTTTTKYYG